MNSKLLVNKELVVAFKKTGQGEKWLAIYNQGLINMNVEAISAPRLK
jgi:hypothetical protein|tara:strand:- start:1152 stop:1292 length:141 start_codon:yes stop_codon:yes gene_type:complete